MITVSDLKQRHEESLKLKPNIISMFDENGNFNPSNWNSGEGVIRQFGYAIQEAIFKTHNQYYELHKKSYIQQGWLICAYSWISDYNYLQITNNYNKYTYDENDEGVSKCDQYLIMWYKNRGCTELIMKNGKPVTIKQYVKLLNVIEATGFKFNL